VGVSTEGLWGLLTEPENQKGPSKKSWAQILTRVREEEAMSWGKNQPSDRKEGGGSHPEGRQRKKNQLYRHDNSAPGKTKKKGEDYSISPNKRRKQLRWVQWEKRNGVSCSEKKGGDLDGWGEHGWKKRRGRQLNNVELSGGGGKGRSVCEKRMISRKKEKKGLSGSDVQEGKLGFA